MCIYVYKYSYFCIYIQTYIYPKLIYDIFTLYVYVYIHIKNKFPDSLKKKHKIATVHG